MENLSSRIKRLEENLRELRHFEDVTLSDLQEDRQKIWALRYGIQESIQAVIDIACAIVSWYNLGYPESYTDCFRVLHRHEILEKDLTERLIQAVGMRNVLVHEYLDVDDELVLNALERRTDFRAFVQALRRELPESGAADS